MKTDLNTIADEVRLVWQMDISRMDYVRESPTLERCSSGRVTCPAADGVVVGWTEVRRDSYPGRDLASDPYIRRVFWLKPYDRALEPDGTYADDCPSEAVDPYTVAVRVPGERTERCRSAPDREASR